MLRENTAGRMADRKWKDEAVEANWKIIGDARLGITLDKYDHHLPVTIDPVLAYSTHLEAHGKRY